MKYLYVPEYFFTNERPKYKTRCSFFRTTQEKSVEKSENIEYTILKIVIIEIYFKTCT